MDKICTIVASNYLAQAKVLVESVRNVYPTIDIYVLVIDGVPQDAKHLEGAHIVFPIDLEMPEASLDEMRRYYDAMELSTSLKPFLLKHLLKSATSVTYIDPDVMLFSEINEGIKAATEFGIAITPHRLTPPPLSILEKTEINFLKFGIFNLGYIAVSPKAMPMLTWWCERLRFYSTKFPGYDVFTDQKWINFIPSYFEHKVIKSKGYNLASWNLDERDLKYIGGNIHAGSDRLVFIHFAQMSGKLSKGLETKNWRDTIVELNSESRHSLEIIEGITRDYSSKLIVEQQKIDELGLESIRESISNLSYHRKKLEISDAIAAHIGQSNLKLKNKLLMKISYVNKLSLLLERSTGLNGFRDGLKSDLAKIFSKITKKQR